MKVRRALLLFAIVLGLAAVVASVSNPRDDKDDSSQAQPLAVPEESAEAGATDDVEFSTAEPTSRRIETGRAATVRVFVEDPGQVEIQGLGQSTPADDVTPARFELLPSRTGRYPVEFTSAAGDSTQSVGTLVVVSPEP